MCLLEPECTNVCKKVPEEQCTPYVDRECVQRDVQSCNTIQEEVCHTQYETKYEEKCTEKLEKKCETK